MKPGADMDKPNTSDRGVELMSFTLGLLKKNPEGLRPREIYREIEAGLPLDSFDLEIMKGSGLPRWRAALHFQSVAATKAALLIKSDGRWRVTEEGQSAASLSIPDLKRLLRSRYREWRWGGNRARRDDVEPPIVTEEVPAAQSSVLFEDAKEKARAEIDAHLDTLDGYEFQSLVGALLEAMGYATRFVAPPGADGGTDVLAYIDPIGARTPHIRCRSSTAIKQHRATKSRR